MNAIRTAALGAVTEAARAGEPLFKPALAKSVINKTGCTLREAIDAADWATARPAADTLPAGSIVAMADRAWIKPESGANYWHDTDGGDTYSNADIDELVRTDRAAVLRVGDGTL